LATGAGLHWHEAGIANPFVALVLVEPGVDAFVPRPNAANVCHSRQTSSPPCAAVAAAMMPSRALRNVGEQDVFLRPWVTYSRARWLPALPSAFLRLPS
jgi:hypothetical protein